jgi:hypothetical protein
MAGSISEFKSSFTRDPARSSRFDVRIIAPLTLVASTLTTSRELMYRCENAELPGRTLATTERKTYGPIEKLPYLTTYNDLDLTFIVDDTMATKYFFDGWLELVNPRTTNDFNFRSDYCTTVFINQYDVSNKLSYAVELHEAYPISVNQLDLDWSSDGYHRLTVTFAYTEWRNNSWNQNSFFNIF